jgi:hypothetical protein
VCAADHAKGEAATDGFAFPHVGTYFVKVRASSHLGDLMSNVVRVVIRPPQGNNAAIWEALKADKELASVLRISKRWPQAKARSFNSY